MKILTENNYKKFTLIDGNRLVKASHVRQIVKSMAERYIQNPIITNERLEIIDGQHRFLAMKELGKPISYIKTPGLDIDDVIRLNTNAINWGLNDYLDSFVDRGYEHYIKFQQFKDKYEFGNRECFILLDEQTDIIKSVSLKFKKGDYSISDFKLKRATHLAESLLKLQPFYKPSINDSGIERGKKGVKNRNFIIAFVKSMSNKKFKFDTFLARAIKNEKKLNAPNDGTVADFLRLIESIYFHGVQAENQFRIY